MPTEERKKVPARKGSFDWEGHRIAYTEYGDGEQTIILIHGLMLAQKMHRPLAKALARRGFRAVTVDMLGHGASERPRDMSAYCMENFGRQILGLIDELGLDRAVLVGTSLGANSSLEAAVHDPGRIAGMVVEMPVLDNALIGTGIAFIPLMIALEVGQMPLKALALAARLVPSRRFWLADFALDTIRQDPGPSRSVMRGLAFGRFAPHKAMREKIEVPTLVIGHALDPVHPFDDAEELVNEIPGSRLVQASSIVELRIAPQRLTRAIGDFAEECFAKPAPEAKKPARQAKKPAAAPKSTRAAKSTQARRRGTKKAAA